MDMYHDHNKMFDILLILMYKVCSNHVVYIKYNYVYLANTHLIVCMQLNMVLKPIMLGRLQQNPSAFIGF
jgi:hypothetical protein